MTTTPYVLDAFPEHYGYMSDDRDYPEMAAARGRIEPAPRRIRGFLGHKLVFDTNEARYVWEVPYYPQYYIPLADVRAEFLHDEDHPQKVQFGSSRLHTLVGAGRTHEKAARVFDDEPVAGLVRFEWDRLRFRRWRRSRAWSPSTTRSSTSPSTVPRWLGRRRTSADAPAVHHAASKRSICDRLTICCRRLGVHQRARCVVSTADEKVTPRARSEFD